LGIGWYPAVALRAGGERTYPHARWQIVAGPCRK